MILWKVKEVAIQWKLMYYGRHGWDPQGIASAKQKEEIYNRLLEAGNDPYKIDQAIGNSSWSTFNCYSCGKQKRKGVIFKSETICSGCLFEATELLKMFPEKG